METVFNNNPSAFVDMNTLFPVLNDKVGLTSDQWKKAMENANYLYNHLGLADVEVGSVSTVFNEPGKFADVVVTHREEKIGDKSTDYFDFTFYVPTPEIRATATGKLVNRVDEVGIRLVQTPIYTTINNQQVITGYNFDFDASLLGDDIAKASQIDGSFDKETSLLNLDLKNQHGDILDSASVDLSEVVGGGVTEEYVNNAVKDKIESKPITVYVSSDNWYEGGEDPFIYKAIVPTNLIIDGASGELDCIFELINNQPSVFARYGLALNDVYIDQDYTTLDHTVFEFVAVEKPDINLTLTIFVTGNTVHITENEFEYPDEA